MAASLLHTARQLAELLEIHNRQLVLAESCTAGLVAATLAQIPGISRFLCGSAVTYQTATKHEWLGIDSAVLKRPGPVSRQVASAMASSVLLGTPHANLAAAVTGHLGPQAPPRLDGVVYIAVATRGGPNGDSIELWSPIRLVRLQSPTRRARQQEAVLEVLQTIRNGLLDQEPTPR